MSGSIAAQMGRPLEKVYGLLSALLAAGATAVVCFVLLTLLGVVTGVFGHGGAPEWWELIFLPLFFLTPPLLALWAGWRVHRGLAGSSEQNQPKV